MTHRAIIRTLPFLFDILERIAVQPFRTALSALLHRYPFIDGYEAIALSKPLALFARSERFVLARLRNGMQMLVFNKDHVGRVLTYMGDFEPKISFLARNLLDPGDTVLDIGANQGWFSLVASQIVGESGSIHAFEPQPFLNGLFKASLSMNDVANVHLHEVGLSNADGVAQLYLLKGNLGAGRLKEESSDGWSTIDVPLRDTKSYLGDIGLGPVKLLKIDVEGHEAVIFEAGLFDIVSPQVVIFESAGSDPLLERPEVRALTSRDYRIFSMMGGLFRPRLTRGSTSTIDHVAFRADVADQLLSRIG